MTPAAPDAPATAPEDPARPRARAFARLWAATAASNLADGVGLTAAPLLAASLTRDPALVAGLAFAQRLPWFLFSVFSGALVDRFDRRRTMGWGSVLRAAALGGLGAAALFGWANLVVLYAVFFVLGVGETLVDNAALALLPAVVPKERLEAANGRLFATQTVANELVGPPLGGVLFGVLAAAPFFVSAGGYGVAAALILGLRGSFRSARPVPAAGRAPTLLANLAGTACGAVFVLVAQDRLGLNPAGFGLVLAAGTVGGVAGGLAADRLARWLGPGGAIFLTNLLPAVGYAVVATTRSPVVVGLAFALLAFAPTVGNVLLISLRQAIIPDHLLGRVTSAYRLFALGALPLGALFGGALARSLGLTAPYWAAAAIMAVTAFAVLPGRGRLTGPAALPASCPASPCLPAPPRCRPASS